MDSLTLILLTTSLSSACAYGITKLTYRKAKNDILQAKNQFITELPMLFENSLTMVFNNEKTQKAIVAAGALFASGLKSGSGFTGGRGKNDLMGMIFQAIGGRILDKIPGLASPQQQQRQEIEGGNPRGL